MKDDKYYQNNFSPVLCVKSFKLLNISLQLYLWKLEFFFILPYVQICIVIVHVFCAVLLSILINLINWYARFALKKLCTDVDFKLMRIMNYSSSNFFFIEKFFLIMYQRLLLAWGCVLLKICNKIIIYDFVEYFFFLDVSPHTLNNNGGTWSASPYHHAQIHNQ